MENTSLELKLKKATSSLLELARNSCWNKISENTSFIISEIKNEGQNSFDLRKIRKKENDKKTPKSLDIVTAKLNTFYKDLYDINLYIYKSKKKSTIIEIQYYPKSRLDIDFYETIKDRDPMIHSKIGIPPYAFHKAKKYDINWELGGIRYQWNFFLYSLKFKIKYRNQITT